MAVWVAVLAGVMVVVMMVLAQRGRLYGRVVHDGDSGILQDGGATTFSGIPAQVGEPVTYAHVALRNTSNSPARVQQIRFLPEPSGGFEVVDVMLAGPERAFGGTVVQGFPPVGLGPLMPFEGAAIEPGDRGSLIVVGMRLDRLGHAAFRRVEVDYEAGGKRYTGRYEDAFILCTPFERSVRCNQDLLEG